MTPAEVLADLIDRVDEIPGTHLCAPEGDMWLHSQHQVKQWLFSEFEAAANKSLPGIRNDVEHNKP